MTGMEIRPYQEADEAAVIALWREVLPDSAPHNDPATAIRKKRAVEHDLFFVAENDGVVVGTVMGGTTGIGGGSTRWRPILRSGCGGLGVLCCNEWKRR